VIREVTVGPRETRSPQRSGFTSFTDVSQLFLGIRILFEVLNKEGKSAVGLLYPLFYIHTTRACVSL